MTKPSQLNAEIAIALAQQPRDRASGKYAHRNFDALCRCGHSLGEHTADRSGGTQPCIVESLSGGATKCDCEVFRKAPAAKPAKAVDPKDLCSYCGKPTRKGSMLLDEGQTAHRSCHDYYEREANRR